MKYLFIFSLLSISPSLMAERIIWDHDISRPALMSPHFEKKLTILPLYGEYKRGQKLWSGDSWVFINGGIDKRWYSKNNQAFHAAPPDRQTAMKSSIYQLSQLSAAEKYDLLIARYDYPLKKWSRSLKNNNTQYWEGICHGWGPASINHDEPRPRVLKNPDGIEIPFSSSDIKALLSFYYAFGFEVNDTHQMGKRCESNTVNTSDKNCHDDLNAGAFHITLTNKLGLLNETFMADTQRLREVWNNPIHSYKTTILKTVRPLSDSPSEAVKVYHVISDVQFVESTSPQWQTILNTHLQKYKTIKYEYYLEVDAQDEIIGGKWISAQRPDFIWQKRRPARYAGLLSQIGNLLFN